MSPETGAADRLAYTIREVADKLHMSSRSIQRSIKRGDLEAIHIGRSVRVNRDALLKFLGQSCGSEVRGDL